MGRTDSRETKLKILNASEKLFSEKGFDGTGIEEISRLSGTNKALIYYHFKNKEGLLTSLYELAMDEVRVLVGRSFLTAKEKGREELEEAIRDILHFLKDKRALLKILLMESLKGGTSEDVFMELARSLMKGELEEMKELGDFGRDEASFLVYEFFTGFMPIYSYAVFGETWSGHFGQLAEETEKFFIDGFIKSHLGHHSF
jgi:AcrR family transcriptional regulator